MSRNEQQMHVSESHFPRSSDTKFGEKSILSSKKTRNCEKKNIKIGGNRWGTGAKFACVYRCHNSENVFDSNCISRLRICRYFANIYSPASFGTFMLFLS